MTTCFKLAIASAFSIALLSACGGGGGGSDVPPAAAAAAPVQQSSAVTSFDLQSGYKALVAAGKSTNFTISGFCAGSATITTSAPSVGTFEGASALAAATTSTINLTNCTPASTAATSTGYFDSNYNPIGHSAAGVEYGKFLTVPTPLPTSVKVGDTAEFAIESIYTDSSKQTAKGKRNLSYVIESDGTSTNTAIVNLISRDFNTASQLLFTQQSRYRMAASGPLTAVSIDVQYSTTSSTHLVYSAK